MPGSMTLSYLGFSYKTTPIELREKLALSLQELPALLSTMREQCELSEGMILSTCNRVECYGVLRPEAGNALPAHQFLSRHFRMDTADLEECGVSLHGWEAMKHLFRVAASLESMVVGEPQILGQLKEAYQIAKEERATGALLNGLMPQVFRAAKRVRTETEIARYPVSVSYVAVELAGKIFQDLSKQTVMVIGAGDMAELTVNHLLKNGIRRLLITNRTHATAVALAAKYRGTAVHYGNLAENLAEADIIISSTGARGHIITSAMVRGAQRLRKGRPVFFIDIAVPRDIDPEINHLADVYRYDVDDLQEVADTNKGEREKEAEAAQRILDEEMERYARRLEHRTVVPALKDLRQQFMARGQDELEKYLPKLEHLPERDQEQIRRMVRTIINKLLHPPSTRLKQLAESDQGSLYADALSAIFNLNGEKNGNAAAKHLDEPREDIASKPRNVVKLPIRS